VAKINWESVGEIGLWALGGYLVGSAASSLMRQARAADRQARALEGIEQQLSAQQLERQLSLSGWGTRVGQTADQISQWKQAIREETDAAFYQETGRTYLGGPEMHFVWRALKYGLVERHLYRLRQYENTPVVKWGPRGPYPTRLLIRWLTDYQERSRKDFDPRGTRESQIIARVINRPVADDNRAQQAR
jgi:hypothetical protein